MNIQNLVLDINKKCNQIVTANVGEVGSRFLKINIIDNGMPVDLTGVTVYLYAKKADDTKVFNTVKVEDAKQGIVLVEITSQVLAIEGIIKLTLLLVKDNARLATKIFNLKVDETIIDDEAIESANEFGALTESLSKLGEWNSYFEETSGKIEEKYTERLNQVDSQLEQNTSEISSISNMLDFKFKDKISILEICLDTSLDLTDCIQSNIDNGNLKNKVLIFPYGEFKISTIRIPCNYPIGFVGNGFQTTKIILTGEDAEGFRFDGDNSGDTMSMAHSFFIRDMTITSNNLPVKGAITINNGALFELSNLFIKYVNGYGIKFAGGQDGIIQHVDVEGCGNFDSKISSIILNNWTAIITGDGCNRLTFYHVRIERPKWHGFDLANIAYCNTFTDCKVHGDPNYSTNASGFILRGKFNKIDGCQISHMKNGIELTGPTINHSNIIVNNQFVSLQSFDINAITVQGVNNLFSNNSFINMKNIGTLAGNYNSFSNNEIINCGCLNVTNHTNIVNGNTFNTLLDSSSSFVKTSGNYHSITNNLFILNDGDSVCIDSSEPASKYLVIGNRSSHSVLIKIAGNKHIIKNNFGVIEDTSTSSINTDNIG